MVNTLMDKREQLQKIKDRLEKDMTLPLRETAHHLMFGEGNPDAQIYFLGEAPGKREDETGRPFIGQAGRLLDKLLAEINIKREDVYISSIVRFRPPNNRPPTLIEIEAFAPSVIEEIQIVNPTLLITLGRFPMSRFLPGATISAVHGKMHQILWHNKTLTLVPFFHPAAALRRTDFKNALREDFHKIPELLKNAIKNKQ